MLGVGGTDLGQEQPSVALYTEASAATQQEPAFAGGGTKRDPRTGVRVPQQWVRSSCRRGSAQSSLELPGGPSRVPNREESSRNFPVHRGAETSKEGAAVGKGVQVTAAARALPEDIQGNRISPGAATITHGKADGTDGGDSRASGITPPWRRGQACVSAGGDRRLYGRRWWGSSTGWGSGGTHSSVGTEGEPRPGTKAWEPSAPSGYHAGSWPVCSVQSKGWGPEHVVTASL